MKGLICLVGESFRLGRSKFKVTDEPESYEPQRQASLSAVGFMDALWEGQGVETDLFISSYRTRWRQDLESWYGERLLGSEYLDGRVGLENLVAHARSRVDFDSYDFIFALRIDLFVKPMLARIFDPEWDKVMYPQACWIGGHACKGCPRVSDTMVFVPRRLCKDRILMQHGAYAIMVHDRGAVGSVGLMIDTFHDSDSAKDYNPLYRIVGRAEHRRWRGYGYVSDGLNPVESGISQIFDDWSVLDLAPQGNAQEVGVQSSDDLLHFDDLWEWWCSPPRRSTHLGGVVRLSADRSAWGVPGLWGGQAVWSEHKGRIHIAGRGQSAAFVLERQADGSYSGSHISDKGYVVRLKRLIPKRFD